VTQLEFTVLFLMHQFVAAFSDRIQTSSRTKLAQLVMHKESFVFCDITSFSPLKIRACLLPADFSLGLVLDPEDEGDIFLRNVG
jgi:hypothetical protein